MLSLFIASIQTNLKKYLSPIVMERKNAPHKILVIIGRVTTGFSIKLVRLYVPVSHAWNTVNDNIWLCITIYDKLQLENYSGFVG
jgi:hypothetical protein